MNCQDIALILDDADIARLDEATRSASLLHLESCADCAREWSVHARLAGRTMPPLPAGLAAGCRALFAAAPQAGRGRSRLVLGGTLLVVAAAAAMLVLFLRDPAAMPPEGAGQSAGNAAWSLPGGVAQPVEAPGAPPLQDPAQSPAESRFFVHVQPLSGPRGAAGTSGDPLPEQWRAQANAQAGDPARRATLEAFRTAIIDELRAVPGLELVGSAAEAFAVDATAVLYQLSVGSVTEISPAGQVVAEDGRRVSAAVAAARVKADGAVAGGSRAPAAMTRIGAAADCVPAAPGGAVPCVDLHTAAAAAVNRLRETVFPPDPSIARRLHARLQDASLAPDQRFGALDELLDPRAGTAQTALLDPAAMRSVLDLAAISDPALRARIWQRLRGTAHPELLQPLLASAMQDADEARLQAVVTLGEDFAQDPRARSALETVAHADPRPLVRALAERALSGEATWQAYVGSSLQDTDRPPAERVEAFLYQFDAAFRPANASTGSRFDFGGLGEAQIDILARLLPSPDLATPAGERRVADVLSPLGYRYASSPAVTDALLHFLQHGTTTRTRRIAVEVLARSRAGEPRVREALRRTLASDPDPSVRDWVRQVTGDALPE